MPDPTDISVLLAALARVADGDPSSAMDLLQEHYPTARGHFTVTYSLAGIIAAQAGDGDEPLTTEVVAFPGRTRDPEMREVVEHAAAMIAAAGNQDAEGAAQAHYGAGPEVAGRAMTELLLMAGAVINDLRARSN